MRILVSQDGSLRELVEGYATEAELQTFLAEHSELIPVDEIDSSMPPLVCIGFEVGLANGSQDLLFLDRTGLLTIVEAKLKKNRESRREVVGQLLEYAAQMNSWRASQIETAANICVVRRRRRDS